MSSSVSAELWVRTYQTLPQEQQVGLLSNIMELLGLSQLTVTNERYQLSDSSAKDDGLGFTIAETLLVLNRLHPGANHHRRAEVSRARTLLSRLALQSRLELDPLSPDDANWWVIVKSDTTLMEGGRPFIVGELLEENPSELFVSLRDNFHFEEVVPLKSVLENEELYRTVLRVWGATVEVVRRG